MALHLLKVQATSDGYSLSFGSGAKVAKLDGPASELGRGLAQSPDMAEVRWSVDRNGYAYVMAFWRTALSRGVEPFLIDLVSANALPSRRVAKFIPGSLTLVKREGMTYVLGARLELGANVDG